MTKGDIRPQIEALLQDMLRPADQPRDAWMLRFQIELLNEKTPDWLDRIPFDVAAMWAQTFIRAGESIPAPLDQFALDVLDGTRKRSGRGRPRNARGYHRDAAIITAMETAVRSGMQPGAACALVEDCLQNLNIHLSDKAVEKIWRQADPSAAELYKTLTD